MPRTIRICWNRCKVVLARSHDDPDKIDDAGYETQDEEYALLHICVVKRITPESYGNRIVPQEGEWLVEISNPTFANHRILRNVLEVFQHHNILSEEKLEDTPSIVFLQSPHGVLNHWLSSELDGAYYALGDADDTVNQL